VVKRANLFRLPDQMPIDDGAFIEPITVGLHAFHLAQGTTTYSALPPSLREPTN
jgi:threonine dehydrogenase-like Zn-dependent dehydrogenase